MKEDESRITFGTRITRTGAFHCGFHWASEYPAALKSPESSLELITECTCRITKVEQYGIKRINLFVDTTKLMRYHERE